MVKAVYKHAYEGFTHSLNGKSKDAIKSYTKMYQAGLSNPSQAKYAMEEAMHKANIDYEKTTKNSELRTTLNTLKTTGRSLVDYVFNREFRKADDAFYEAYKQLYPRTHVARDLIMLEKHMGC